MNFLVAIGLVLSLIVVGFLNSGGLDYLLVKWNSPKTTEEDDPREED